MSRLTKDSSFSSAASTSQEGLGSGASLSSSRTLRVTLLSSEWGSTKGGLSAIIRQLAIQLAQHPNVVVSVYLPQCTEEDKRVAASHNVQLIEAEEVLGYDPVDWLSFLPENHAVDCIIVHGVCLGKQVQFIKRQRDCKWIQVVHTDPEELGMYKSYEDAISKGEKKHQVHVEVRLCQLADQVVAIGPKLAEALSSYLRFCGKDQDVISLNPSIFAEFSCVRQATEERRTFCVLVLGRGEREDFHLKGYDIAAQAIAELKGMPKRYKLVFVGAPSGKEEQVKEMLLQQGIGHDQLDVHQFDESREHLAELLCEVDLALMPSRTEGFGLAALEALSAGLPVLVSGNSGLGEALKKVPYGSHCVVDSEDPKEWAKAIMAVRHKDRKVLLKESVALCREYAETYSWQEQCAGLVEKMVHITLDSSSSCQSSTHRAGDLFSSPAEISQPTDVTAEHHRVSPESNQREAITEDKDVKMEAADVRSAMKDSESDVPAAKEGEPLEYELEELSEMLGDSWEKLARRLGFHEGEITGFHKDNEEYSKKALKMLFRWKQKGGAAATYHVLYQALCNRLVERRDLAERFCCKQRPQAPKLPATRIFNDLQEMHFDAEMVNKKTTAGLSKDLKKIASDKGFVISENPASGNCMFYALCEQLQSVKGIKVSHRELRKTLVHFLREDSYLHDGTPLFNFVCGYPSWPEYLGSMEKDGTWGDNLVLLAAANCYRTDIRVVSSLGREVFISPDCPVANTSPLVLGHIHEEHYVSLRLKHGTTADEEDSLVKGGHLSTTMISQGCKEPSRSHHKGSSKSHGLEKGKRPLSSSGTPSPKKLRLLADAQEGTANSVVVKLLKAEYNRRAQLRPLLWDNTLQLPLENVYTRLKIVSRPKAGVQAEGNEVNVDEILGTLEKGEDVMTLVEHPRAKAGVQAEENEVNVCDIFGALEKGEDVMTLVEGSPGIGKTTFCLKLAYDWANENTATRFTFAKFELVLLLKCRDIDRDIMEAISEQLLPKDIDETTREELLVFIRDINNQERILIILDGLDELPQKSKQHVDELLHRRILPFCYVLATTRQEKAIEVRKDFVFDILLQIEGFTESDAFEYIKKHFANIGPGHSSKGEMLIEEIKENTSLHALRNNPLNLLLLCVIYEDYEGKLPSSRSALYQIIVRCLLRRYCVKHNLEAHKDDNVLEKKFRKDILALGKLAWKCLLTDRYGFREEELTKLESRNEKLIARELGLLYKEESLKRLAPQHEYCFLHKTFQEYLAALYIARKLRKKQFDVFEHLTFDDLVTKYPQVFLFVSGILGEEASILFSQIGEKLQSSGDWNWVECSEEAATFFTESFSESGNAEKMAVTLCSFIPFPLNVEIYPVFDYASGYTTINSGHFIQVLEACQSFSNLQQPVKVTVRDALGIEYYNLKIIADALVCCSKATTLSFSTHELSQKQAEVVFKGLTASTRLSHFALTVYRGTCSDGEACIVGKGLAASKTLTNVTFQLGGECSEAWVNALGTGLSADTPLTSVALRIYGSMSNDATRALERFFSNKSLTSLSLVICGDIQDQLAAALGKGLSEQTFLNSLDVQVNGKLGFSGAHFLERGLLENRSLNYLRAFVYGELPDNWQTVVKNLRFAKGSQVSFAFHPDTCSTVAGNQVAQFRPVEVGGESVPEQRLTVNLWGELSSDGAKALCEALILSPLSGLTLHVRGKLTEVSANCIARCLAKHKTLSSVTIVGELTNDISSIFQGLSDKLTVVVNKHDVPVFQGEPLERLGVSIDNPASLKTLLIQVKNTRQDKLSVTINVHTDEIEGWRGCLRDCLSEDTIKALTLTINNHNSVTYDWMHGLGEGLAKNTSLNALTLTINNYSDVSDDWMYYLGDGLAKNTSLNALTLAINNYGDISGDRMHGLGEGFAKNTSLKALTLTTSNYGYVSDDLMYAYALRDGLAKNTSLNALTLTINNYSDVSTGYIYRLGDGLVKNTSLNALTLTINNYSDVSDDWLFVLCKIVEKNTSINTLTLTINNYSDHEVSGYLVDRLDGGLAENKSLSTFNVTVNMCSKMSEDWLPRLCHALISSESLTTLRLQVNNQCVTSGSHAYDFSKLLVNCRSLALLALTVSFYGVADSSLA